MSWLIACLLLLLAGGLYATLAPLRLRAQGRAGSELEPCGTVSASWGPLAVRLDRTGSAPRIALLLCGRPLIDRVVARAASKSRQTPRRRASSLGSLYGRIDAADALRFMAAQRRHVRVDVLEGELSLGFADPALTGQAHGWLCGLSGALPVAVDFRHQADWSGTDRFAIEARIALRIFVGRIALASALFLVAQLARHAQRSRAYGRAEDIRPSASGHLT